MRLINLKPYVVNRAANGEYDNNGKWVESVDSPTEITIRGNLQPITGRDMNLLPSGFTATNIRKIYTRSELKTLDEDLGTEADILIIDGVEYQVQSVEQWIGRRLSHYKAILVKKEKTG